MTNKEILIESINIKPTFTQSLAVLLMILENGNEEGKKEARKMLYEAFELLDRLNAEESK
jgi:hypothetical protein